MSRDLSYSSLLLVLLTAKLSSILDIGGLTLVSRNENEVAKDSAREVEVGDKRKEVKEAEMKDKKTEARDNQRNQNNVISSADDDQSKDLK